MAAFSFSAVFTTSGRIIGEASTTWLSRLARFVYAYCIDRASESRDVGNQPPPHFGLSSEAGNAELRYASLRHFSWCRTTGRCTLFRLQSVLSFTPSHENVEHCATIQKPYHVGKSAQLEPSVIGARNQPLNRYAQRRCGGNQEGSGLN